MVGFDTSDDASVYLLSEESALIQTVDIFPPVVDDPYEYGQIAAANALSDVYAMGGTPKLALNILCYPQDLPKEAVQGILQGGYEKVLEGGAIISGGHTLKDPEPKYGLSVSGFAHPKDILTNKNVKPGDVLILTKAIGTGVLTTAMKGNLLDGQTYKALVLSMAMLNKRAAEIMGKFKINSCTDITGFGLLGHAYEMAEASGCLIEINAMDVPVLEQGEAFASMGIVPAGAYENRKALENKISMKEGISLASTDLMFDPQTSGGLLISLPEAEGMKLLRVLQEEIPVAKIIGVAKEKRTNEKTISLI